jgi:GNAT superfamily N-acetyltransferase
MIRRAEIADAELLTQVSFASKGYWGYPESYFKVWARELTVSSDYINENDVFVYEAGGLVVGFYSMIQLHDDLDISGITLGKGFWLDHMFVKPESIGLGIGTHLFNHLDQRCKKIGVTQLGVLADPNARGFYEKMGCTYVKEYPSTIKNRTTPYLVLCFDDRNC